MFVPNKQPLKTGQKWSELTAMNQKRIHLQQKLFQKFQCGKLFDAGCFLSRVQKIVVKKGMSGPQNKELVKRISPSPLNWISHLPGPFVLAVFWIFLSSGRPALKFCA